VKYDEFEGHKQAPKAIKVMLLSLLDGMRRRRSAETPRTRLRPKERRASGIDE
jgi:hypothetical protein